MFVCIYICLSLENKYRLSSIKLLTMLLLARLFAYPQVEGVKAMSIIAVLLGGLSLLAMTGTLGKPVSKDV
jgi:hypothetical protein